MVARSTIAIVLTVMAVLLLASHASGAPAVKTRESAYAMQHSFGGGDNGEPASDWVDCGVLRTRVGEREASSRSRGPARANANFKGVKVDFEALGEEARKNMEAAARAGGYYRLRIAASPQDGPSTGFVVTSVRASCLFVSNFRNHLTLHFDESGLHLLSADHVAAGVDCDAIAMAGTGDFDFGTKSAGEASMGPTTTSVKFSKTAPALTYVQRRRRGDDEEGAELRYEDDEDVAEEEAKKDERTWLQKNWMLCLAGGMMFMNLLGSALEPPRQQQRRGGGGGGGAAVAR